MKRHNARTRICTVRALWPTSRLESRRFSSNTPLFADSPCKNTPRLQGPRHGQAPQGVVSRRRCGKYPAGFRVTQEFCNQIAYMLLELMDEQPEVLNHLSGRTFARTFHEHRQKGSLMNHHLMHADELDAYADDLTR